MIAGLGLNFNPAMGGVGFPSTVLEDPDDNRKATTHHNSIGNVKKQRLSWNRNDGQMLMRQDQDNV